MYVCRLPGDWISIPEMEEIQEKSEGHFGIEGDNGSVAGTREPMPM
jgi:hypothetical protein